MSVTFNGAFTFSGGGFTASLAPFTPTAGWFAGGNDSGGVSVTTVNRITFTTDTATASVRGPLSSARYALAGSGTFTYGWFGGGYGFVNPTPTGFLSTVERITYATDTATASVRGPLSLARYALSSVSDGTTYSWYGGGGNPGFSTVDRITYATDTATASIRGSLNLGRNGVAACTNLTYGYFGGGVSSPGPVSSIDRITYATDTATATSIGTLSLGRRFLASTTDTTTYGWFAAGYLAPAYLSVVDRITYATDTATASVRGPLSLARGSLAGTGNTSYGWFSGGTDSTSIVDRIDYANDTATATARGPMSLVVAGQGAAAGLQ